MSKWTTQDIPSLTGKRALVTGANSGIGFHAARHLAVAGCSVVLACRDSAKGEVARRRILKESANADVEVAALDLASLASIDALAASYLKTGRPLDLLINNAGVMAIPSRETTVDGFEKQFGTNHLGHFALTGLLLPALRATHAARVVTVASIAHKGAKMQFEDLQYTHDYKPWPPYGQSKLANLLFAFELNRRMVSAGSSAISVAVHPGLSKTSIFKSTQAKGRGLKSRIAPTFMAMFAQSDEQGSYPTLYAATSPNTLGGHYYGPGGVLEWRGAPVEVTAKAQALDEVAAARLWEISESLTGVRYVELDIARA